MTPRPTGRLTSPAWSTASAVLAVATLLCAPAALTAQMATADRVKGPGWWPTRPDSAGDDYVGSQACVRCHPAKAGQQATSMARTFFRAADSPVLRAVRELRMDARGYSYVIERSGEETIYRVSDGTETRSAQLAWAFGAGNVGQTYLFELDGALHEARASYYDTVKRLDFTPNRELEKPRSVLEAMARPVDAAEARRCFGCHTTASTTRAGFDPARLVPGVTCEACHGPGRRHVTAVQARDGAGAATILDPSAFDAIDSVDFCGACHGTFWDVTLAGERGLAALRSQPFRLQSSACWKEGDARLTCVACHDPHRPLAKDPASYDEKCLSCHPASDASSGHPGRSCRVAEARCVTCHMPKYEVPVMHYRFTDHLIRIVRP